MMITKKIAVGAAAAAVLVGAATTAVIQYQDVLLEPARAEWGGSSLVDPNPTSFWPAKNTLQQEPCRYWLGFTC